MASSPRQQDYLRRVARQARLDESATVLLAIERYERIPADLNRRETSDLIDHIQTTKEQTAS